MRIAICRTSNPSPILEKEAITRIAHIGRAGEPTDEAEEIMTSVQAADGSANTASLASGDRNEVHLIGRLAALAEPRTLPSGSKIAIFRLIVRRPPERAPTQARRSSAVDVIDCVAWTDLLRDAMFRCKPGDVIEVRGALRRRFWRTPASAGRSLASRYEVELTTAIRLGASRPATVDAPS
jgi:single-strand DNA-binding protein